MPQPFRNTHLRILAALLLCSSELCAQSFDAANKHVASVGAVTINISLPDTFAELMARDEQLRAFALASKAPGNELLGFYAGAEDVRNASKEGLLPFYLKVAYMTKLRDRTFSESDFSSLRTATASTFRDTLTPESPEYQAYIRQLSERVSRATSGKVGFSVPDVAHFGIVSSTRDHFTVLIVANQSFTFTDHTVTTPYLVATTYGLVRGRLLFLYAYKKFQGGDDVTAIKEFSERWFTRIRSDNP